MLVDVARTLEVLRAGACMGLSVLPFDTAMRFVNHTAHPAQTPGLHPPPREARALLADCMRLP